MGHSRPVTVLLYLYLNFLETSGPLQACNGTALPLPFFFYFLTLLFLSLGNDDIKGAILFLCNSVCKTSLCALTALLRVHFTKCFLQFPANYLSALIMEEVAISETSVHIYQTNRRHILEERIKEKVQQSRNRPGVAQRVPGGLGSQISMTFGT